MRHFTLALLNSSPSSNFAFVTPSSLADISVFRMPRMPSRVPQADVSTRCACDGAIALNHASAPAEHVLEAGRTSMSESQLPVRSSKLHLVTTAPPAPKHRSMLPGDFATVEALCLLQTPIFGNSNYIPRYLSNTQKKHQSKVCKSGIPEIQPEKESTSASGVGSKQSQHRPSEILT